MCGASTPKKPKTETPPPPPVLHTLRDGLEPAADPARARSGRRSLRIDMNSLASPAGSGLRIPF